MFSTVTNFLFSNPSGGFENIKTDNNHLKSFKSFNDFSDFQKKSKPNLSNDCCFPDRSLSCNLPIVVSDEYDMFCPLPDFSPEKKKCGNVEGSSKFSQPDTVLPTFNQNPNHNFDTSKSEQPLVDIQMGSNNCFSSQFKEGDLTTKIGNLPEITGLESSQKEPLAEINRAKVKPTETSTSLSELAESQSELKPPKLTKDPSKSTDKNASFKGFGTKKKISSKNKKLSSVIPDLDLEFDHISTNLEKIQTRYSISFIDKKSKQPLLIHINCKNNTQKVSQEQLIDFVMNGSILVHSFVDSGTKYRRIIADSKLLEKISVQLIFPAPEQEMCPHKGVEKIYCSEPSESYTQYRKDKNQQDLNNTWIRGVLCRSPNEESYFREYSYINNIGRIQYGKSPGKKNELLMIPLFSSPEEEETLPSLRDVSGIHLDFMRKIEQQKNELFSPYLNGDGKIYICTDLHPTIYVLHFKISLHKHSRLEELSDIIENLSKNKNHYKDMVIENVRLSNLDPLTHIFKESVG